MRGLYNQRTPPPPPSPPQPPSLSPPHPPPPWPPPLPSLPSLSPCSGSRGGDPAIAETKSDKGHRRIAGDFGNRLSGTFNLLCWNCRGIGNDATIRELRELAKDFAPKIICLIETQVAKNRAEGLVKTLGFHGCFGVNSEGRSGSLCIYWKEEIKFTLICYSSRHIDGVISEGDKPPWHLTCIYGEAV